MFQKENWTINVLAFSYCNNLFWM